LKRQRLFIAELSNDSLGVVDLAGGKVLRRIDGMTEPQGVDATRAVQLPNGDRLRYVLIVFRSPPL
jgi:hypothetical protein